MSTESCKARLEAATKAPWDIMETIEDLAAALRVIEAAKEVRVAWAAWGGDFTDTAGVARFFLAISHLVEHDDAWEATP